MHVSVIIPNHRMGRFLPEAIASIERQDVPVDEIIVVDTPSDEDAEIISDLPQWHKRIRVLQAPPDGPAKARNIGLQAATGDVIAFLDADDVWPTGKLALQLARLDRDPPVDLVSGFVVYFDELDPVRLEPARSATIETKFLIHVAACVCRRSVFDRVGLFDESFLYSEDVDFYLRVLEAEIPMTILQTPTLYYRQHPASMMARDRSAGQIYMPRAFAKSLARRRRNGLSGPLPSFESFYESVPEAGS